MKIFVAGDKYFRPDLIIDTLKEKLSNCSETIEYDSVYLPYPIGKLTLYDGYVIPSGMAWDQNMDEDYGSQGVREYYGRNDTLKGKLGDCNILIIHGAALPAAVIDEATNLKLICVMRGGPVNVDIAYARSKGIRTTSSPGKNAQAVAEFAVGLLLAHTRQIPTGNEALYKGDYLHFGVFDTVGYELENKKAGLIGFGNIAQRICKILKGFDCDLCAYDPYVSEDKMREMGVVPVDMDTLLKESDIVSVHARASSPLIGKKELAMMKPSAILLNTARGVLVDYKAAKEALEKNQIGGFAFDVFGDEPYEFYREMLALPNVTATPHIAGASKETVLRGIRMIADEIRHFIEGEPLDYEIQK